ncbi:hypothetical protein AX16_006512 [Volvariella volvacea WC 439]|nr:hypothetical protein AX16_006512 [Volvariella volvacea WC 439]
MFLATLFLAVLVRSLASPVPTSVPSGPIPNPICIVAAAVTASQCGLATTRTIYEIIYSCLGTILLCTYVSIHHNIPGQNSSSMRVTWGKVKTSFYALLAPEVVIMWALRQRIVAERIALFHRRELPSSFSRERGVDSQTPLDRGWTRTHGFFVQMGGLMVEVAKGDYRVVTSLGTTLQVGVDPTTQTLRQTKGIDAVPNITTKEINDHGKGDPLAKAIVVIQTSWFIAQCIARLTQGIVVTELELVTLAFAVLNAITYVLWWDKPLNVGYPIYFDLHGRRVDGPQAVEEVEENGDEIEDEVGKWYVKVLQKVKWLWTWGRSQSGRGTEVGIWGRIKALIQIYGLHRVSWGIVKGTFNAAFGPLYDMTYDDGSRISSSNGLQTSVGPYYAAPLDSEGSDYAYVYGSLIGLIFGAIHVAGWNFTFSTTVELWLWRSSSLILVAVPFFIKLTWLIRVWWARVPEEREIYLKIWGISWRWAIRVGSPLYIVARCILFLQAFYALRALPDSAYQQVRWTEFIPHI